MTAETLKKELANNADMMLVDVRENYEFENGSVPGAQNIPMGIAAAEIEKMKIPKDKKIIVICRSGNRSGFVTNELKKLGYNAENLEGGLIAWTGKFGG